MVVLARGPGCPSRHEPARSQGFRDAMPTATQPAAGDAADAAAAGAGKDRADERAWALPHYCSVIATGEEPRKMTRLFCEPSGITGGAL